MSENDLLLIGDDLSIEMGDLHHGRSVVFNSKSEIIVTDPEHDKIIVYDRQGKFLFEFGKSGHAPGSFINPKGLAVDQNDNIIVSDSSTRFQVFDRFGTFIRSLNVPFLRAGTHSISVNKDGNYVFIDGYDLRTLVLDKDGEVSYFKRVGDGIFAGYLNHTATMSNGSLFFSLEYLRLLSQTKNSLFLFIVRDIQCNSFVLPVNRCFLL
jgi:DNA-binding beta-propeller fold protein YncE